jgi:ABC-2 type transport system permease protein
VRVADTGGFGRASLPGRGVAFLRVFFVGGLMSYRVLFAWLRPAVLIPVFLITPIFQIMLFVYLGRGAHLESDSFYVIGNAIEYAAVPCLFAMGNAIADERQEQTLSLILVTPAARLPLFLGRALPVIANGFVVSAFALVVSALIFGFTVPPAEVAPIALAVGVCSFSCTGLGLVNAALGLRMRETAVTSNVILGLLMVFCGVNIPLVRLPRWMAATASYLPLTHGIAAARKLAAGAPLGSAAGLIGLELAVALAYAVVGMLLLRGFEFESRRRATLDRSLTLARSLWR